jgi:hypothetical protein
MKKKNGKSSKSSKFNHQQFILHFDSIFVQQEIGEEFQNFLKSEKDEGAFLFLNHFKQFKFETRDKKQQVEKLKEIIESFLLEGSIQHLNISDKAKSSILEVYETLLLENDKITKNGEIWIQQTIELLVQIERTTRQELEHHHWKRFLRIKSCESIIRKYHMIGSICSPQISQYFTHSDDYFNHSIIFDRDFEFANLIFKDSFDWTMLPQPNNDKMNVFFTDLNFLPNVSFSKNTKTVKFESVIPLNLQTMLLAHATNTSLSKSDPHTSFIETKEYYHFEELKEFSKENGFQEEVGKFERNLSIGVMHIKLPFPLNPRVYNHSCSMKYDPVDQSVISLMKPFVVGPMKFSESSVFDFRTKDGKINKNIKTYPLFSCCFTKYQKIDEEKVLFSQVLILDLAGWANQASMTKLIAKDRASKFLSSLMKIKDELPKEKLEIEDHKNSLCKENEGKIVDGLGKLLYELKIDEKNKQFQQDFERSLTEEIKIDL